MERFVAVAVETAVLAGFLSLMMMVATFVALAGIAAAALDPAKKKPRR